MGFVPHIVVVVVSFNQQKKSEKVGQKGALERGWNKVAERERDFVAPLFIYRKQKCNFNIIYSYCNLGSDARQLPMM